MENAILRNEINKIAEFLRNDDTLFNLKHRWEDEKDYEDFAEYKTIIQEKLLQFSSNIKITKGFQITLTMTNLRIIIKINKNSWKIKGGAK
jgi:hypothetical protein|tara:strand:- start:662 stop:934 length:273 start_codon:yes stop_codon:yes gene_type:complete